jgi:hypothetical protein
MLAGGKCAREQGAEKRSGVEPGAGRNAVKSDPSKRGKAGKYGEQGAEAGKETQNKPFVS